jgi:hypothetical protein
MKSDVILMLIGGVLVATGVIGGGFEVKELKMPKVGRLTRFFAICSGGTLILIGLVAAIGDSPALNDPQQPVATQAPEPEPAPAPPVQFVLLDDLGPGQVSEQVTVVFDGSVVGTLKVDTDFPSDEMTLTAPEEGNYTYHLEAEANFYDPESDTIFPYSGVGQGTVYISEGAVFRLAGSMSGDTWAITLIAE